MSDPKLHATDDPVLTTRGAAQLLGVAVSTAQQWVESGVLPAWKTPGGHRRVRLSDVTRLLRARAAEQRSAAPLDAEFLPPPDPGYPVSPGEARRLAALHATGLVGTPPEEVFDRLTWLASQITECPMAAVSLLTSSRQWFKSRVGVDVVETPRQWSFCSHVVMQDGPFMVEDARLDARFDGNPLVTGEPHIRFYGGFPLLGPGDLPVGALCVLDREPRRLREREVRALRELAAIASEEIRRRGAP